MSALAHFSTPLSMEAAMNAVFANQGHSVPLRKRLFELVASAPAEIVVQSDAGQRFRLAGVGAQTAAVRDAPLRFVLDQDVSARCRDRVRMPVSFDLGCERLRLPAPACWIEWFADDVPGRPVGQRIGAFIEADANGRRGQMTCYFELPGDRADHVVMSAKFDFEQPLAKRAPRQCRIRHDEMRHLAPLFEHVLGVIDRGWWRWINRTPGGAASEVRYLASAMWFCVPMTLAFLELLDDRRQRIEAGTRAASTRRYMERSIASPPLDVRLAPDGFAEVSLTLGARQAQRAGSANATRSHPCMHLVRGHLVTRGGKTFWRRSHQRGDGPFRPKVISVHL